MAIQKFAQVRDHCPIWPSTPRCEARSRRTRRGWQGTPSCALCRRWPEGLGQPGGFVVRRRHRLNNAAQTKGQPCSGLAVLGFCPRSATRLRHCFVLGLQLPALGEVQTQTPRYATPRHAAPRRAGQPPRLQNTARLGRLGSAAWPGAGARRGAAGSAARWEADHNLASAHRAAPPQTKAGRP